MAYGRSALMARGDYRKGYARGDPGLFGFLKKAVGAGVGFITGGGPVGLAARTLTRGLTGPAPSRQQVLPTTPVTRVPGIRGFGQRMVPGGATGLEVVGELRPKRRRMNVTNPKALRRAIRRTDGFVKLARRALKGTGYTVKRRGAAAPKRHPALSIKESGAGGVTVQ